jgi:drug/metabolite transporter (DMT)-like permease
MAREFEAMVESNGSHRPQTSDYGQQIAGIALVVLSAICIAIVPSLAKLAYDGGSNTLSVITGRSVVSVIITLALLLLLRRPMQIPFRPLAIGLVMGVGYAIILYGYLGAVNYLPVNQAILIYFIHPLLVGFSPWLSARIGCGRFPA